MQLRAAALDGLQQEEIGLLSREGIHQPQASRLQLLPPKLRHDLRQPVRPVHQEEVALGLQTQGRRPRHIREAAQHLMP